MDGQTDRNKLLVQIVDDNLSLRLTARAALEQAGFTVIDADNGKQALNIFVELLPDLVLLDVLMPEMDGFTICREIRGLPGGETVPIVMLTALDDVEAVNKAFEAGATDFIVKPINWTLLGYRVHYVLRACQQARSLRKSQARLAKAQELARMGVWECNRDTRLFSCSVETCRILEIEWQSDGISLDDFFASVHPEERGNAKYAFVQALEKEDPFNLNYRICGPIRGEQFIFSQGEFLYDERRRSKIMTGITQDITKMKQAEEKIFKLAFYDELTGLPNRMLFLDRIEMALNQAKRRNTHMGLLFLDLDRFKRINDSLGHHIGDELLKNIGRRLRESIRETDSLTRIGTEEKENFIARLGGDEFIILLIDIAHPEDAARVARRIKKAISQPVSLQGHEIHITPSIGISVYPTDGTDAETMLKNADVAMYHAKKEGRDNYQFYRESLNASTFERLKIENDILKAIELSEFQLYFQPLIHVATKQIVGAEALIRWQHPQMGMIQPYKFIDIAEETGMILKINEWVIQEACRRRRQWYDEGLGSFRISINVSGYQITRQNLALTIQNALESNGISSNDIELELTENILLQHGEETVQLLDSLKGIGLKLSIDDFGTGYSSLSYLTTFPVDTLKIDRSFILGCLSQPKNVAIIRAIIAMGHSLGMKVVAEGVETKEHLAMLQEFGCDIVQGYFFSMPVPAGKFSDFYRKSLAGELEWYFLA